MSYSMWKKLLLWFWLMALAGGANGESIEKILSLEIHSTINPATLSYIQSGLKNAQKENADLILIRLSTPGGYLTTTKDILSLVGTSDIPFAIWVTPEGSSATSAGAILAGAAHILVMSEGTNIGAATPIEIKGDVENEDARSKAVNDLVALVQSLAETRGRNSAMFGEMVDSAASFKAQEAKENNLIDGIVNSDEEFYSFLNNRKIHLKGQDKVLTVPSTPTMIKYEMDPGQKLLNIFANPGLAYMLFLIGLALIYLELQAPGGFIAGAVGTLCLLLAGIGFQVLPLNFGGLGLIVLALILFILEAFVTSFGLLTLAGLACLIIGPLLLYRTDDSYLSIEKSMIFSSATAVMLFVGFVFFVFIKERKKIGSKAFDDVVGKSAKILAVQEENSLPYIYQVKVGGEIWTAVSENLQKQGDRCIVKGKNNLMLQI